MPINPLIVIPARFNSQRLPGKPLKTIEGIPLIIRTYRAALSVGIKVIVVTDNKEIAACVRAEGGECLLTSSNCSSGTMRIVEGLSSISEEYQVIINWQGDEPFIAAKAVATALVGFISFYPEFDMATLATYLQGNEANDINAVKLVAGSKHIMHPPHEDANQPPSEDTVMLRVKDFSRNWPANEPLIYRHIGLYIWARPALLQYASFTITQREENEKLEQLRSIVNKQKIIAFVTKSCHRGVDNLDDLEQAKKYVKEKNDQQNCISG